MLWGINIRMSDFIKTTGNTYDATPSYKLLQTMGYGAYELKTAVADIIDNSITAEAKNISVNFHWEEQIENCYVEIRDDGFGMTSKELERAMRFSDKGIDDERTKADLGKYGLGMKTASFYACHCLTVISKKAGHRITAKRLDQDVVSKEKKWIGENLDGAPELDEYDIVHGTVVRWDKLNFIDEGKNSKKFLMDKIEKIAEHISIYFNRFIDRGISITVNGYKVRSWDPSFKKNPGTTRVESKEFLYDGQKIKVQSYLLPPSSKCTEDEIEEIYRNDALKYQGFYVYRNDRLLIGGGWLGIRKLNNHQQYNPVRIIVDIPTSLDADFKVDFTKSGLQIPAPVERILFEIAKVARSKASEAFKNRARKVAQPGIKTQGQVWNVVRNKNGTRLVINKDHPLIKDYTKDMTQKDFNALIKLLSGTIPHTDVNVIESNGVHYTDEEMYKMIQLFYLRERVKEKSNEEIHKELCSIEPFNNYLSIVEAFFEQEVLK